MEDKVYSIYKATCCVNGKSYIGFSSSWPQRMYDHKKAYTNKKNTQVFYRAINKYGWDSFDWEVLYQSKDKEHTLKEMEPYFIKLYKSQIENNGYNMTRGGESFPDNVTSFKNSGRLKKGNIPWNKGKKASSETKLHQSLGHKGKKNPHKGVKKTKEIKEKISKSLIGNKRALGSHSTAQDWEIIFPNGNKKIITSLLNFCKEQKLRYGRMRNVSKGLASHHKGFKCMKIETVK
jgi:group I intron endonuclease